MKVITKILIGLLFFSLIVNLYQWNDKRALINRIEKKDKAITEIRNSIKIITQTNNSIDSISIALKNDFKIDSEVMYRETDSSYYLVLKPKDWNMIDHREIWEFFGLEIIFDKEKKFKQIDFYKP